MLKNVRFQSIRALRDVTLSLDRLTFLVGPNGCGKSTLLDQVDLLCRCSHSPPSGRHVLGQAEEALTLADPPTMYTTGADKPMVLEGTDHTRRRLFVRCDEPKTRNWFSTVALAAATPGRALTLTVNSSIEEKKALNELLADAFSWRSQRLSLIPAEIAAPVDVRVDQLAPSGYGLASALMAFALNDQETYAALQADMREIVPQFEKLHISRTEIIDAQQGRHGGVVLGMVMRGAGYQPATAISDGTLLALALLTATHSADLPPLVLMDDIDHGLHLSAQVSLIEAIRRVMAVRPELQVICTTHSPYLLDAARPEEVRVMALDESGHTVARPLTEHPDFARQHRGLQTGEFWATFGEDWVRGESAPHG